MKTKAQLEYEQRSEHLETPEFKQWFETWYAPVSEYSTRPDLLVRYFNERNFALAGWIAGKVEGVHLMSRVEFSTKHLPVSESMKERYRETGEFFDYEGE